jgi:hypothetical protein
VSPNLPSCDLFVRNACSILHLTVVFTRSSGESLLQQQPRTCCPLAQITVALSQTGASQLGLRCLFQPCNPSLDKRQLLAGSSYSLY